jgi:hypothetical protein
MQEISATRDITGDDTSDVTWMTYAELGEARGINAASAKRLAIRRHWRRHRGNDGTARVAVPVTEAVPRETKPGDDTSDVTEDVTSDSDINALRGELAFETALSAVREAKDGQIAALTGQIGLLMVQAETQAVLAIELKAQRDAARADLALAQQTADALRTDLDRANAETQAAQDAAEELRQDEIARRARGRWARLWDAWRG